MDNENLSQALQLMGIGMTTVFCVLLLIIFFGNMLIKIVNRFIPEDEKPQTIRQAETTSATVDANVALAIDQAIMKLTGGKFKSEKIEKI